MKKIILLIVIIVSIFIINTNNVSGRDKNLYYDNFRYSDNVNFKDKFDYHVDFNNVGDYYEIIFDVVNESNNSFVVEDLIINDNDEYFSYELTYLDNSKVNIGDKIDKNSITTMKYRVDYKKQVINNYNDFDTSFNIDFGQKL